MKPYLISMFLLVVDIGLLATYFNVRDAKVHKGLVKVLGYIVIILTIITLISFSKL